MDIGAQDSYSGGMKWTFPIGTYCAVPFRLHWSWGAACLFLLLTAGGGRETANVGLGIVGLLLSLIGHEAVHIAVGNRYGRSLPVILLSVLGRTRQGELRQRSLQPKEEVRMALAAPFFNLLLGSLIVGIADLLQAPLVVLWIGGANLAIGLLNLLPAFPLDGGFALRGFLRFRFSDLKATRIATVVGQLTGWTCVGGGLAAGAGWWAVFLGLFILISGRTEELAARFRSIVQGRTARDVMQATGDLLPAAVRVSDALEQVRNTTQSLFPVCFGTKPLGLVTRMELEALERSGRGSGVFRSIICFIKVQLYCFTMR